MNGHKKDWMIFCLIGHGSKNMEMFDLENKSPEKIRAARLALGLTQKQAAAIVHSHHFKSWQRWENGEREMPLSTWELFLIKTKLKKLP